MRTLLFQQLSYVMKLVSGLMMLVKHFQDLLLKFKKPQHLLIVILCLTYQSRLDLDHGQK